MDCGHCGKVQVLQQFAILTSRLESARRQQWLASYKLCCCDHWNYFEPERIVSFFEDQAKLGYPRTRVSPPTISDIERQRRIFQDVAAVNETGFNLAGGAGGARQLSGALVTYNLFSVLSRQR